DLNVEINLPRIAKRQSQGCNVKLTITEEYF
ncbi:hypothetical protein NPIL_366791, partial [Nephila pilipes]